MARKEHKESGGEEPSGGGKHRTVTVVSAAGDRYPFLRGMVTNDLIRRGLDFDRAYATADALRSRLRDRGEITEEELASIASDQVTELFGSEVASELIDAAPPTRLWVLRQGEKLPFSRGLLARSILAAGVEFDRAYRVVIELHDQLVEEGATVLPSREIVRRITSLLKEVEGKGAARRYHLVRRIPRLPRPTIVYLGGASGTGKSTLGFELAPLLRVYRVNSTDTVRQVMRMVFSPAILPSLHTSSFERADDYLGHGEDGDAHGSRVVHASFEEQARRVLVGVRAVVERAIQENMSIIVEGVHLVPPLVPFADLEGSAYQIPLVLGTLDVETHRSRFLTRARLGGRRAERYVDNFKNIRLIHDWVLEQAEVYDVPMLDTSDPVPPVSRALKIILRQL